MKAAAPARAVSASGGNTMQTPAYDTADFRPGEVFANRYKIINEIGRGGMGSIFKAHDIKLNEPVALKLLLPGLQTNEQLIQRFIQEIKLALKITHENVVRIYDIGEVGKMHFISMEYIEGIDLKKLIQSKGAFTLDEGLDIIRQIADGLSAAHKKGIVHRDVKPQNVLIGHDMNVKIVDFGIAKIETSDGMTREGVVIGTPEYMSPEQALAKKIDLRTDIYSLGIIMYEVFTGRLPFIADTPLGIALKHVNEAATQPRKLNPRMPEWLERITLRAMEKDPDQRYQSMDDLSSDLVSGDTYGPDGVATDATGIAGATSKDLSPETLFQRGMELFTIRKYREALQLFEQVLKHEPDHHQAYDYMEIAGAQIAKEASVRRLLAEGEQALQANDIQRAYTAFQDASEQIPDDPEVQIALRKIRSQVADLPTAQTPAVEVRQFGPTAPQPVVTDDFERAKKLYEQKKYAEAIDGFQAALATNPNHTEAYELLEIAKAAKSAAGEIEHHFLTARRLVEEGDELAALSELEIILDYDQDHQEANELRDRLEAKQKSSSPRKSGQGPEGQVTAEMVPADEKIKQAPPQRNPAFVEFIRQAKQHIKDGNMQEALDILNTAAVQFPDYEETSSYIDKVESEMKRRDLQAIIDVGKEMFQQNRYHQAMSTFKKVLEQEPANADVATWIEKTREMITEERKKSTEISQKIKIPVKETTPVTKPEEAPQPEAPSPMKQYLPFIAGGAAVLFIILALIGGLVMYPKYQAKKLMDLKSRGQLYFSQGRYDNASEVLQQAIMMETDEESKNELLDKLARTQFYSGQYLQSQATYQQLLTRVGERPAIHFFLGQIHEKNGNYQKAFEEYEKAIALDDSNYEAFNAMGNLYLQERSYDRAINFFTISLELNEKQADIFFKRAQAWLLTERDAEAELDLVQAISVNPRLEDPYLELAKLFLKQNKFHEGISVLDPLLAWAARSAELYFLLGTLNEKLSDQTSGDAKNDLQTKAIDFFRKCTVMAPENREAIIRIARILMNRDEFDAAVNVFRTHLDQFPNDAIIHFELGFLYHRNKRLTQSLTHYRRSVDIDPSNAKAWANLGTLYNDLGNVHEAQKAIQKSLDIDPSQAKVRTYLDFLKRKADQ